MGHKTLSEIRAELRSQGIDTDRLRKELSQLFEQPRRDKQSVQILSELTKSLKTEAAKKTRKRRTSTAKSGK